MNFPGTVTFQIAKREPLYSLYIQISSIPSVLKAKESLLFGLRHNIRYTGINYNARIIFIQLSQLFLSDIFNFTIPRYNK